MNGSRSMEFSSCYPQAGCPAAKPQKTVLRGDFSRKSLKKLSSINYINWITGIEFHILRILEVHLLDNCVLYPCWKFDSIRLKPCKDIVREIQVIGLIGDFEKYGFKVFLRSLRAQTTLWTGRGVRGRGRGLCRKVLHKYDVSLNTEYTPVIEMLTKYKEHIRWQRKQCSGPWRKILISIYVLNWIGLITVFDAILTGRQRGPKLQCLYGNPIANNLWICESKR